MVRTFIAIEIPELNKKALATAQADLKAIGADVSWTKPDNLHLTLKFLGEINDSQVAVACSAVKQVCENTPFFELEMGGIGVFPNARRPRVIWAGLTGDIDAVISLQSRIESALVAADFAPDDHPFSPHLTIGRIKTPKKTRELLSCASEIEIPRNSFGVNSVVVMRSQLHPTGSIYTPIEIRHLGK